jgi:glutathione synthase/RimK-type ligase-like ATP-grasp enzyme
MKPALLILGREDEETINPICKICHHRGIRWFRLNGEDLPYQTVLTYHAATAEGHLTNQEGATLPLKEIGAVWYRRHGTHKIAEVLTSGQAAFVKKEFSAALDGLYFGLADRFWVNDYLLEKRARSKGFQLQVAHNSGLHYPESIVTTQFDQARDFWEAHEGKIIVKPFSESGFIPGDRKNVLYTNLVTSEDLGHLERVRHCPTFFQRYIEKDLELRITVVGRKLFATAIESQSSQQTKIDWRRYDLPNTPHYPFNLPKEISQRILRFMDRAGLQFGAIDMILEKGTGKYFFLECNSAGQWGWVARYAGHLVDEALVDLFAEKLT